MTATTDHVVSAVNTGPSPTNTSARRAPGQMMGLRPALCARHASAIAPNAATNKVRINSTLAGSEAKLPSPPTATSATKLTSAITAIREVEARFIGFNLVRCRDCRIVAAEGGRPENAAHLLASPPFVLTPRARCARLPSGGA